MIDLKPELYGPVFEPLLDASQLRNFTVHLEFRTLVWKNGADVAPKFRTKRLSISRAFQAKMAEPVQRSPQRAGPRRIVFISDPDGNVIELMQIRPESAIYRE